MAERAFTPIIVGDFTVPHRIVLAPLTRFRANEEQVPKEFVADYYGQRATCKGLLITEATSIHEDAARFEGSPGIYSEDQVKAWRKITDRVHEKGGKIFMQLWHSGRTIHSSLLDGRQPVSSSAVRMTDPVRGKYLDALGRREAEVPRELSEAEVKIIVEQFINAAQNAVCKAGFDGVEIHGANGYLVDQFLRDGVNQRTDSYGGSIEKRCKFALDIIAGISEKIGEERTGIRFNPFGSFNSMSDSDPVALFAHLFQRLNELHPNMAYIHLTEHSLKPVSSDPKTNPMCEIRKFWKGNCILNLNRLSRETAIELIAENMADMVSFGRDFIANPDLPLRLTNNLPLNPPDPTTFYTHDTKGYTDYPFYESSSHIST